MRFIVRIDATLAPTVTLIHQQSETQSKTYTVARQRGQEQSMNRCIPFVATVFLLAGLASAQTFVSSLGGTVTDASGAVGARTRS